MNGVDLSHYQDGLDLGLMRDGGYSFAILKLSEGRGIADASFDRFYDMAKQYNIPVGAYVFSHALTASAAKAEAEYALSLLKGRQLELGIYIDVETTGQMQIAKDQLKAMVKSFVQTVNAAGYAAGIYGSEYNAWSRLSPEDFKDSIIWIAHYGKEPELMCDIWQKTDKGGYPGYYGKIDVDESMSERFNDMVNRGESETSEDVEFPDDPFFNTTVGHMQVDMHKDGYWPYAIDGLKSELFFEYLTQYIKDMKSC